jgi:hypothetical protein
MSHAYLDATKRKMEHITKSTQTSPSTKATTSFPDAGEKESEHKEKHHNKLGVHIEKVFRRLSVELSPHKKSSKSNQASPEVKAIPAGGQVSPLVAAAPPVARRMSTAAEFQMLSSFGAEVESGQASPNLPAHPTLSVSSINGDFALDESLSGHDADIWKDHANDFETPPVVVLEKSDSHHGHVGIRGWRKPKKAETQDSVESVSKAAISQALFDTLPPIQLVGRNDSVKPVMSESIAEKVCSLCCGTLIKR